METRTRDLIFGTGRGADGLRGVFAPRGSEPVNWRELAATYRGPEQDRVLSWAERRGIITAEQRAGNAAATSGVDELAAGTTRGLVGASSAASAGSVQYANPIYNGLMAQSLMREHGFVAPTAVPDGAAIGGGSVSEQLVAVGGQNGDEMRVMRAADAAAAGLHGTPWTVPASTGAAPTAPAAPAAAGQVAADAPIAAAGDDIAAHVANLEQRLLTSLQRLGGLPQDAKVPALARAVDATARHGGDSFDVLSRTLLERPLDDAVVAFERSLHDAAKVVTPIAEDAAKVVTPIAEDAAKAAPAVVEAVAPPIVAATRSSLVAGGTDDALRGVMSFSAGIDDTLRMLARF